MNAITMARKEREELHRLKRVLDAIRECNRALVRATDVGALLKEVCKIIVDLGGYRLAWVGCAEQDEHKSIRAAGYVGYEEGYLETLNLTWADSEHGRGPTGTAIRTGQISICNNILTDPNFAPWRADAIKRGYASSIALPLKAEGQTFGALNIYAAAPDAFDSEELELLQDLAEDLAYGITMLHTQAAKRRFKEELALKAQLLELASDSIIMHDLEGNLLYANEAAYQTRGYGKEELLQLNISQLVAPEAARLIEPRHKELLKQGALTYESAHLRKDGSMMPVEVRTRIIELYGRKLVLSVVRDITAHQEAEEALREREARFKMLVEHIPQRIFLKDRHSVYITCNRHYAHDLGIEVEAIAGKTDYEFYPRELAEKYRADDQQVMTSGIMVALEEKYISHGRDYWVRTAKVPYRNQRGDIVGVLGVFEDITEQRQVEEALRRLHHQPQLILSSAGEGIVGINAKGTCTFVNPAAASMLGYEVEEFHGCNFHTTAHYARPDGTPYPQHECPVRVTLKEGLGHSTEDVFWKKDGSSFPVDVQSYPLMEDGQITGAVITFSDITARKEAEEALQREKEFSDTAMESLPGVFYLFDANGKYLRWNSNLEQITGYTGADFAGMDPWDLFRGADRERTATAFHEALQLGEVTIEAELAAKDGGKTPYLFTGRRVKLGDTMCVVGLGIDITARKEMEERLAKEKAKYQALVERIPGITYLAALDESSSTLFISPQVKSFLGYTPEEWLADPHLWFKTVHPEDLDRMMSTYQEARDRGEPFRCEYRILTRDQQVKWVLDEAHPVLDESGRPLYSQALVIDITDRKLAEGELSQALLRLEVTLEKTIGALGAALEMRDPYTAGHQRAVTALACEIARELGLSEERIEGLRLAGLVHDIGKIYVPAEILAKPTRLSEVEENLVRTHAQAGYEILKEVEFPWPIAQMVLQHHERLDGSGYPQGLAGPDLLLEARILAVADVVEAMSAHRPYRAALGLDLALAEISRGKGTLYDPRVVEACLKVYQKAPCTRSLETGDQPRAGPGKQPRPLRRANISLPPAR